MIVFEDEGGSVKVANSSRQGQAALADGIERSTDNGSRIRSAEQGEMEN